jgi:hypothetical protein
MHSGFVHLFRKCSEGKKHPGDEIPVIPWPFITRGSCLQTKENFLLVIIGRSAGLRGILTRYYQK